MRPLSVNHTSLGSVVKGRNVSRNINREKRKERHKSRREEFTTGVEGKRKWGGKGRGNNS